MAWGYNLQLSSVTVKGQPPAAICIYWFGRESLQSSLPPTPSGLAVWSLLHSFLYSSKDSLSLFTQTYTHTLTHTCSHTLPLLWEGTPVVYTSEDPGLLNAAAKINHALLPSTLPPSVTFGRTEGQVGMNLISSGQDIHCWAESNFGVKIIFSEGLKTLRYPYLQWKWEMMVEFRRRWGNSQMDKSWALCCQDQHRHSQRAEYLREWRLVGGSSGRAPA